MFMIKVVLDTNVLINAERGDFSYPKRILNLIMQGQIEAVITEPVRRENILLIDRLVNDLEFKGELQDYFVMVEIVKPAKVKVEIDDPEDIKLIAAAVGGEAQYLITEDVHLLELEKYQQVSILKPADFWTIWEKGATDNNKWQSFAQSILGK